MWGLLVLMPCACSVTAPGVGPRPMWAPSGFPDQLPPNPHSPTCPPSLSLSIPASPALPSCTAMDVINTCLESNQPFHACSEPLIINVSIWAPFFLVTSQLYGEKGGRKSTLQQPNGEGLLLLSSAHLWDRSDIEKAVARRSWGTEQEWTSPHTSIRGVLRAFL